MSATTAAIDLSDQLPARVLRIEVRARGGEVDPAGDAAFAEAKSVFPGLRGVRAARVFLIEAPLGDDGAARIAQQLLTDPVSQEYTLGHAEPAPGAAIVEVHYLPGVMDPVAQSTRAAIIELLSTPAMRDIGVRTGFRYDFRFADGASAPDAGVLSAFAETHLANTVVQEIHTRPFHPESFPHGHAYDFKLIHVPIRDLDDTGLRRLSREGHLFLSLDEMRAIREYYRDAGREPTDIELETLAQTWSEHCVHKTLKSTIAYHQKDGEPAPAAWLEHPNHKQMGDGTLIIENLLKSTVAAATQKLMQEPAFGEWCVSVFVDNAGIIRFDDTDGVCIKVETHNHPSALEPYGGAATGIGGCIRDVIGTGLAAKPIANTNVFCVAPADRREEDLPRGVIHPRRVLSQVVAGVRDYGNRMGIPTVNGAVQFHEDFLGNPLVFAGSIGLIPLDRCFGQARPGDRIVALGGATGRDGIHGATFSSAELTDTHADEFSHAVQIGNAITQKKTMDVILRARDYGASGDGAEVDAGGGSGGGGPLFSAITDCGAGGFSSAIGEMGEKVGARVELENAPLKYQGLTYTEIWISEAQERMVLAVPPENVATLRAMCEAEDVDFCDLGHFGESSDDGKPVLVLNYRGEEVGRLSMRFMHEGIPTPTREAYWPPRRDKHSEGTKGAGVAATADGSDIGALLKSLLSHPNIASKHWIIRQYDHEVQGGSTVKPLVGPEQDGPSDAAVIRPKLDSRRGIAIACGLAPQLSEKATARGTAVDGDSYWATLAAIDEAVRNAVCVGASPEPPAGGIAILDNFCWPSCDDPYVMGTLVRAAEACYRGALAYRTPFVSGKDSLNNQFTAESGEVITIPQTLLVTALGVVEDVSRCRTMDAKAPGNALLIVGATGGGLGGSHLVSLGYGGREASLAIPRVDLDQGPKNARAVAALIGAGLVASAHDCSDGGLLVAAAEMAFAGRIGLDLDLANLPAMEGVSLDTAAAAFAETPSRYLLEVQPDRIDSVVRSLREAGVSFAQIGTFADHQNLTLRTPRDGRVLETALDELRDAWRKPLDW